MNGVLRSVRLVVLAGVVLSSAIAASAQSAPEPEAEPLVVVEDAPRGTSQDIAVGAGVGVLVGLVVAVLLLASASD
jgi:hypothetical protein